MDLRANGDVLEIRGKTDRTMDLACDVALPMAFGLDQLETVYADEALAIRVLPPAKARKRPTPSAETLRETMRWPSDDGRLDTRPSPRRNHRRGGPGASPETRSRPPASTYADVGPSR